MNGEQRAWFMQVDVGVDPSAPLALGHEDGLKGSSSFREMLTYSWVRHLLVGVNLNPERDRRRISPVRVESWSR